MINAKKDFVILENVTFTYPDYPGVSNAPVLKGVNLSFPADRMSLVLGGPETGKTTLSRIIAGLIPRHTGGTLKGRIHIPGIENVGMAPPDLIEHVGIVFQDADEQIVMTRCDYEAAFALESLGLPAANIRGRVSEAFEIMGLEGFEERNPARLSGGEKKKLLLASLLALNPETWILDETLEEIDLPTRKRLLDFISHRGERVIVFASRCTGSLKNYFSSYSLLASGKSFGPFETLEAPELTAKAGQEGLFLEKTMPEHVPASSVPVGDTVLIAEDICYAYPGEGSFCLDVEGFSLNRGETVCLVGRNGCGKSTFGKILCGLIQPTSGLVKMAIGESLPEAVEARELNSRVGYMFQNPDYQIFLPSVREELSYGLEALPKIKELTEEAAALFSLGRLDAPPALLSYGTRKRLQAACYYLLKRPVYILDEADSGLSYRDFRLILSSLSGKQRGLMVITHDIDLAREVADRIIIMSNGRLDSEYHRGNFRKIGDLED